MHPHELQTEHIMGSETLGHLKLKLPGTAKTFSANALGEQSH